MFCQKCGKELPAGTQFCDKCGAKQDASNSQTNTTTNNNSNISNNKSTENSTSTTSFSSNNNQSPPITSSTNSSIATPLKNGKNLIIGIAVGVVVIIILIIIAFFIFKKDKKDDFSSITQPVKVAQLENTNNSNIDSGNSNLLNSNTSNTSSSNTPSSSLNNASTQNTTSTTKTNTNSKCEAEYQALLDKYGRDFSDCGGEVKKVTCNGRDPEKPTNLVIILDSSGSMKAQMNGQSKMDIAKEAVKDFVSKIDDDSIQISLVVYGHKGGNAQSQKAESCSGIEEVYYLGAVNKDILNQRIDSFNATGWTPIASSLEKAKEILTTYSEGDHNNVILLVSDGKETCDGDPVNTAKNILNSDIHLFTDVIGFGVSGSDASQLKSIASAGKGRYFSANSKSELYDMFAEYDNVTCMSKKNITYGVANANNMIDNGMCSAQLIIGEGFDMNIAITGGIFGDHPEVSPECKQYATKKYAERKKEIEAMIKQVDENFQQELNRVKNAN
jgi:Mg-chelatase subunit ChlD